MPINILLVEDEPAIRSMTAQWLSRNGYAVDEAENGKAAWDHIQRTPPEVVITDVAMPEMDGVELCRLIKTTGSTAGIPVLMFTSHSEADLQLAGTEAGRCGDGRSFGQPVRLGRDAVGDPVVHAEAGTAGLVVHQE